MALIVRYAPWWLNLNPTHTGTPEHQMMVVEIGGKNYEMDPLRRDVYAGLPEDVKPLFRHFVASYVPEIYHHTSGEFETKHAEI